MWRWLRAGLADDDPWACLGFMHACLIVILLTAPITWTTNRVWLTPLTLVILFAPEGVLGVIKRSVANVRRRSAARSVAAAAPSP